MQSDPGIKSASKRRYSLVFITSSAGRESLIVPFIQYAGWGKKSNIDKLAAREGFDDQGDNGEFWSRSAHPDNSDNAFNANFNADEVNPGDNNNRDNGIGVRSLLDFRNLKTFHFVLTML